MATQQVQKKDVVGVLDKELYEEIKQINDKAEKLEQSKCDIVKAYAKRFEKEGKLHTDTICKHITDLLHDLVGHSWVAECLDKKYKNQKMSENRAGSSNGTNIKNEQSVETEHKSHTPIPSYTPYKLAKSIDDISPAQIKETAEYYFERYKENQFEIDKRGKEIVQLKRKIVELEKRIVELEQDDTRLKVKGSPK